MKSYKKFIPVSQRPLTNREYEVLKLLTQGKTNTEIKEKLGITIHTTKAHMSSILLKMKARDRLQAVIKALNEGWIMPE